MSAGVKALNDRFLQVTVRGAASNFLMGAGLAYSIEKETYWHLPIAILFPSAYAGYHLFKNAQSQEGLKVFIKARYS